MTGHTTNCGLILNSCKKLISDSKHPVWLWGPFSLYSIGTEGPSPEGQNGWDTKQITHCLSSSKVKNDSDYTSTALNTSMLHRGTSTISGGR